MNALQKAVTQTRALSHTAASRATAIKQAGGMINIGGGAAGGFSDYQSQATSRRNYSKFRGWVYAAVNAIAKEGAGQAVQVCKVKGAAPPMTGTKDAAQELEVLADHPLLDALEHPNSMQGKWQFVYSFIANICLTGWSFVVRDEDDGGKPRFYSVPTTWVRPDHTKGPFAEFRIVNPRDPAAEGANTPPLTRDQVGFAYLPDPSDPLSAMPPAMAQAAGISIDEKIQESQVAFFDNGIFPSVVITMGQQPHPSGEGLYRPRLTAEQRRQVYAAIRKVSGGIANYGNPAIIDGLIEKIERLSATQNEMGWEKSEKTVRTRILSAFCVHPFILGEEMAGSYAQAYIVESRFYKGVNTYLDMCGGVMTELGNKAVAKSSKTKTEKVKVVYMPCKAVDPSMEKTTWEQARVRGDITQNEWRAKHNLPPDEDKQQQHIEKTLATPIETIAKDAQAGAISRDQAKAILMALGLPEDVATDIAGEGPPTPPPMPMMGGGVGGKPIVPPAAGGGASGKPGGKPGAKPPAKPGEKPPAKPANPTEAAKKALTEAAEALRFEYPFDQEVREILELADRKGGPGSGDWGHVGRPGKVGGSGGGGGHHTLPEGHPYAKPKPAGKIGYADVYQNSRGMAHVDADVYAEEFALNNVGDSIDHIARSVGAPWGSDVGAFMNDDSVMNINYTNSKFGVEASRDLDYDNMVCFNESFTVEKNKQGQGIGTTIFAEQVKRLSEEGFNSIETYAARSDHENGYYTWARLGYDAYVPDEIRPKLPVHLRKLDNLSDLMKTQEGRDAWKKHGISLHMQFDLSEGSLSRQVLDEYVKSKGAAKQKGGAGSGNFNHSGRPGQVGGSGEGRAPATAEDIKFVRDHDRFFDETYRGYEDGNMGRQWRKDGLTAAEAAAVTDYTGFSFSAINDGLRHPPPSEKSGIKAQLVDQALEKLPKFDGVVYRGLKSRREWEIGQEILEKGFCSTSSDKQVVMNEFRGQTLLRIISQSGRSIKEYSSHDEEEEILFKSGTRFVVTDREERTGMVIYELEEVEE